jgi:hypothetical protein
MPPLRWRTAVCRAHSRNVVRQARGRVGALAWWERGRRTQAADALPFAITLLCFFAPLLSLEVIFWPYVIADGVIMASNGVGGLVAVYLGIGRPVL